MADTDTDPDEHAHPGPGEYVQVAAILAVVTALEVVLYYTQASNALIVPALLLLTVIKFALVVLWFMHLRFDHRMFRRLFLIGLGLAGVVYAGALATLFTQAA
ncbi:MAG: cytochrome C oxidase subunit IV family protein [Actinomycetota bacterium]|nr:cytochrome C oxidase subunit IV family protein [Actinomycetota bacterium]